MSIEPTIVGILCHWCSYSAADGAGAAHREIPHQFRPMRVMCTGRVDPALVLEAFRSGAAGVLISGCRPGDCHYISGNYKAAFRVALLERVLEQAGIDPRRLRITWAGASEDEEFARVVGEMVETVRGLGPLSLPESPERSVLGS